MPIDELKMMRDRYDALNKGFINTLKERDKLKKENEALKSDLKLCKDLIAKLSKTITDMVPGKEVPDVVQTIAHKADERIFIDISNDVELRLKDAFPGSFINPDGEFIAHKEANSYFILKGCKNELDVKCKVLEWLSRDAYKTAPFYDEEKNEEFRDFMRNGINIFLDTDFVEEDMEDIYVELGNCVNHEKTIRFVESDYDMNVLKEKELSEER